MEPSMSPERFATPGHEALAICIRGTSGGKSLVERTSLTEAAIVEVKEDMADFKTELKDMKSKQSAYGKSTIFLLVTTIVMILMAYLQQHK